MQWSQKQEKALDVFNKLQGSEVGIIRGYAGTGKSSLLKSAGEDHSLVLLAPTGKAARRIKEVADLDARTIHSFLYKPIEGEYGNVSFERKLGEELTEDLFGANFIVVDEASMLSRELWNDLRNVSQEFKIPLVLIGDGYQLPPVDIKPGAEKFSAMGDDFIVANAKLFVDLDEVFRQAKESPILRVATEIRQGGDIPMLLAQTFDWLTMQQVVEAGARTAKGEDGIVICHTNKTRHLLNRKIRDAAGYYGKMPVVGEKLMITKNDYGLGVSNGEILQIDVPSIPLTKMPTRVKDRRSDDMQAVDFFKTEIKGFPAVMCAEGLVGEIKINEWEVFKESSRLLLRAGEEPARYIYANYGYAGTAHKCQGSQYDSVVMVLEPSVRVYEKEGRQWCYTTLTRSIKNFSYTTI